MDLQAVLDRLHLHTQHQLHTAGLQLRFHEAGDILVQGPQQPVQHLHNGDRNAQAIEEGGEFHANDAATHNDDVLGARGHVQQAGGIHHTGQVHAGNGDPGGAGASGHDQVVAGQVLTAGQMDRLPVRQGGVVGEHRDAVALLQEGHAVAQLLGDGVLPLDDFGVVEGDVVGADAEGGAVFGVVIDIGGVEQGLGGDAAPVQAGAAQLRLLHQGGLQAVLAQADGALVAAGAAAHDDGIKFLHRRLLRSAGWDSAGSFSASAGTWRPRPRR